MSIAGAFNARLIIIAVLRFLVCFVGNVPTVIPALLYLMALSLSGLTPIRPVPPLELLWHRSILPEEKYLRSLNSAVGESSLTEYRRTQTGDAFAKVTKYVQWTFSTEDDALASLK